MDLQASLSDRVEIIELTYRYAAGMDMLDRAIYEACFTDPLTVDFWLPHSTHEAGWDGSSRVMSPSEWTDFVWNLIAGLDATQHLLGNHRVNFAGDDRATCVFYLHAQHYYVGMSGETYTVGGYYTDDVVRASNGWKIERCGFRRMWETGDDGVFERGQQNPHRL